MYATHAGKKMKRGGRLPIFCFCMTLAAPVCAAPADEIRALAELSPAMALQRLDQMQPPYSAEQSGPWQEFERLRLDLYAQQRAWQTALARIQKAPAGLGADAARWLETRRLAAQIELGQAENALAELRARLWASPPPDSLWLLRLRQLVVRAYLAQRQYEGAAAAAQRYSQDYAAGLPQASPAGQALQADAAREHAGMSSLWIRALIHAGNYAAALQIVDESSAEARLLTGQARLMAQPENAEAVADLAAGYEDQYPPQHPIGRAARVLLARAASRLNEPIAALHAQADALAVLHPPPEDLLFSLSADDLWSAYESYGRQLAAEHGLERGYTQAWLTVVEEVREPEPLAALGLATAVLLDARDRGTRDQAAARVLEAVQTRPEGTRLALALFTRGRRISQADLPPPLRFALAQQALALGEGKPASMLLASMAEPPAGTATFDWELARLHSALLGGANKAFAEQSRQITPAAIGAEQFMRLQRMLRDAVRLGQAQAAAEFCEHWLASPLYTDANAAHHALRLEAARAYLALGRSLLAADHAWRAQSGLPPAERPAALRLAGQALLQAGRRDDAQRAYQSLLKLQPPITAELAEELRAAGLAPPAP